MLYFACGSNLNLERMAGRCPRAVPLGRMVLPDWRLAFRCVADCVPEPGAECHGGVWRITPQCERALDVYEGVAGGTYRKEYIPIDGDPEGGESMLMYCMNSTGIDPPAVTYLKEIEQGYRDFRMPKAAYEALAKAVRASWDNKHLTHVERQRHRRNGRPPLAAAADLTFTNDTGVASCAVAPIRCRASTAGMP